jgi:Tripartite tricarboxylate transporter family receptor
MARTLLLFVSLCTALTHIAQPAFAQWPERPIKLIVPFAAGSSSDTIARIIGAKLGERLGQQIVVENRVGGSTVIVIGTDAEVGAGRLHAGARQHHDACGERGAERKPAVRSGQGLHPGGDDRQLAVRSDQRAAGAGGDARRVCRAREIEAGALSYASAGTGTLAHLAGELFKRQAGVDVAHVPYRGCLAA